MEEVIASGTLMRRSFQDRPSSEEVCCELRFIDESRLPEIMGLQEVISRNLPDKEIFRLDSEEYFRSHFQARCAAIAAFADERLIAYHFISFPSDGDNFGMDIGISGEDLRRVAHLETVAVHPDYRGNSLQRIMAGHHLQRLAVMGYEHICCTISPRNLASLQNGFSAGLAIKGLKIKYGWMTRYIMHMNLLHPEVYGGDEILIDISDIAGQKELLSRGLSGFRAEMQGRILKVVYGKKTIQAAMP
jgi:GNAT superfamily N-acetyltransferase